MSVNNSFHTNAVILEIKNKKYKLKSGVNPERTCFEPKLELSLFHLTINRKYCYLFKFLIPNLGRTDTQGMLKHAHVLT